MNASKAKKNPETLWRHSNTFGWLHWRNGIQTSYNLLKLQAWWYSGRQKWFKLKDGWMLDAKKKQQQRETNSMREKEQLQNCLFLCILFLFDFENCKAKFLLLAAKTTASKKIYCLLFSANTVVFTLSPIKIVFAICVGVCKLYAMCLKKKGHTFRQH